MILQTSYCVAIHKQAMTRTLSHSDAQIALIRGAVFVYSPELHLSLQREVFSTACRTFFQLYVRAEATRTPPPPATAVSPPTAAASAAI